MLYKNIRPARAKTMEMNLLNSSDYLFFQYNNFKYYSKIVYKYKSIINLRSKLFQNWYRDCIVKKSLFFGKIAPAFWKLLHLIHEFLMESFLGLHFFEINAANLFLFALQIKEPHLL